MTDIYQPPESNLIDKPQLGEFPRLGWPVFWLYLFEGMVAIAGNYFPYYGEEPIELLSIESAIMILLTVGILIYVWYLLKNGKRQLHLINYILLGVSTLPVLFYWFLDGINLGIVDTLSIASGIILVVIIYICKKTSLKLWLIHE